MKPKRPSIVQILCDREYGFYRPRAKVAKFLHEIGAEIAEINLLDKMQVENLFYPQIDERKESQEAIYNFEESYDGKYMATLQSQKCIHIYDIKTMTKLSELKTEDRSVWTLAFHPLNSKILAVGTFGGRIIVFGSTKDKAITATPASELPGPILSICFHPTSSLIFAAMHNKVYVYDYTKQLFVKHIKTYADGQIRYIKYNSLTEMIITGMSKKSSLMGLGMGVHLMSVKSHSLVNSFLKTVNVILDRMEYCPQLKYSNEINNKLHLWNYLMKMIGHRLVDLKASERQPTEFRTNCLHLTLDIINRRLGRISRIVDSVIRPDAEMTDTEIRSYYSDVLTYFQIIHKSYFYDDETDEYLHYSFDLETVDSILYRTNALFLRYTNIKFWKRPFPYSYQFYEQNLFNPQIQPQIDINRHRFMKEQYTIQAWDCQVELPDDFTEEYKNVIANCYINNDATIAISKCLKFIGSIVVLQMKQLEIRSLLRQNLGECLYVFKFIANFVSISFSPSSRFVIVGVRSTNSENFAFVLDKDTGLKRWDEFSFQQESLNNSQESIDNSQDGSQQSIENILLDSPSTVANGKSNGNEVGLTFRLVHDILPASYKINCIKWSEVPGYGLYLGFKSKYLLFSRSF